MVLNLLEEAVVVADSWPNYWFFIPAAVGRIAPLRDSDVNLHLRVHIPLPPKPRDRLLFIAPREPAGGLFR